MATSIVMPQMGYDMHEGKVVRWLKKEGEDVTRGEVIAEIETDKATVEYKTYTNNIITKIITQKNITIQINKLITIITNPNKTSHGQMHRATPPSL